jgi:dTMP kinase
MARGRLLVIEGVDGSGKNTQSRLLVQALTQRGIRAELVSFPRYADSMLGPTISDLLAGRLGPVSSIHPKLTALLFAVERHEMRAPIQAWLDDGVTVVCDRYVYSNIAHQAVRLPAGEVDAFRDWLLTVEFDLLGMPRPDATVLLDLDDAVSRRLREARAAHAYSQTVLDEHEKDLAGMARARSLYHGLATLLDWQLIDCAPQGDLLTPPQVFDRVWPALGLPSGGAGSR